MILVVYGFELFVVYVIFECKFFVVRVKGEDIEGINVLRRLVYFFDEVLILVKFSNFVI